MLGGADSLCRRRRRGRSSGLLLRLLRRLLRRRLLPGRSGDLGARWRTGSPSSGRQRAAVFNWRPAARARCFSPASSVCVCTADDGRGSVTTPRKRPPLLPDPSVSGRGAKTGRITAEITINVCHGSSAEGCVTGPLLRRLSGVTGPQLRDLSRGPLPRDVSGRGQRTSVRHRSGVLY